MQNQNLKTTAAYAGIFGVTICAIPVVLIIGTLLLMTSILWVPALIFAIIGLFVVLKLLQYTRYGVYIQNYEYKMFWTLLFNSRFQQKLWRALYNAISSRLKDDTLKCMNLGYAVLSQDGIYLENYKSNDYVYQYQLYDYALLMVGSVKSLKGKTFVEVGCGRGGCFEYIANEYKPTKAIGFDLSRESIQYCREKYTTGKDNISFYEGDSQLLKEHDQVSEKMADVVMNIESSHCYPNIEEFFKGVHYLLKDDGVFVYADFRLNEDIEELNKKIDKYFEVVKHETITRNVVLSLNLQNDMKKQVWESNTPWYMKKFIKNFMAMQESRFYDSFNKGENQYFIFALKKKSLL